MSKLSSEIKPIYGLKREILGNVIPLSTPYSMFVFPTTFCNFKCQYCAHSLGLEKMREKYGLIPETMRMDVFKLVVNQIKQFPGKLKLLSLTGQGEPLINKNIAEMVEYAKKADIAERIEIITNGSLLNKKLSLKLIDAGLDTLKISIQGIQAEKYLNLCNYNLDFSVFLDEIAFFYSNREKCSLFVKTMDIALEDGEEEEFYHMFSAISDRMFVEKCQPVYDGVEYTTKIKSNSDRFGYSSKKREVCPLPFYMLGVFPNGDVEPCDSIYKPIVLGNTQNISLVEMWKSKKLREFQIMQLEKNRMKNPKCSVCCAPNDISHPEDDLDQIANDLLLKL